VTYASSSGSGAEFERAYWISSVGFCSEPVESEVINVLAPQLPVPLSPTQMRIELPYTQSLRLIIAWISDEISGEVTTSPYAAEGASDQSTV